MKSRQCFELFIILTLVGSLISACAGPAAGATLVWIDVPLDGLFLSGIQTINIDGHATSPGGVSRVEIWTNGVLLTTLNSPPADGDLASFHYEWTPSEYGGYTIQALAFGTDGTASEPDSARVLFERVLVDALPLCAVDALAAPLLISPADGATVESDPVLTWSYPNEPCRPHSYKIDISEDESFSDLRWGFGTLDDNETSRSWPLAAGECYFWRAQAYVPDEFGPTSSVWSFCVTEAAITETPTPITPPSLEPIVQFWADPTQIQAGACTTIKWHVENVQSIIFGGIQQDFDGSYKDCLCKNERYSLTVTYLDGSQKKHTVDIGVSGVCETPAPEDNNPPPVEPPPSTEDTTPPPVPSPAVPANGLELSCRSTQTLAWLPVSDPSGISGYYVKLEIQVKPGQWKSAGGYGPISDKQVSINVQCGGIYRWMVRAQDGAGNFSNWSAPSTFSINLD